MPRLAYLRRWSARLVFWGGALLVGASAAGFAKLTDWATHRHQAWSSAHAWLAAAAIPIVFVLLAEFTRRLVPAARGSGIPQAIAALDAQSPDARGRLLSIRIALAKVGLTTVAVLGGASVGREGPTVHVGASLMHALGRWIEVPYQSVQRSLILAGGAAGIAAAFNTPIAGIVFAVEEMARSFEERATGTVLTAVIIAGVTSVGILGNYVYFGHPQVGLPGFAAATAAVGCGLVAGVCGGLFSRFLLSASAHLKPHLLARPIKTVFALGLIFSMFALWSQGAVYCSGYGEARELLDGTQQTTSLYPLFKFLATLVTYLTGIPGGIFSPSLSIGVGIGADLAPLFPKLAPASVMVLGMAAYFAGVTQAPMTGAIIVMEMIDRHEAILPILASAFVASAVSKVITPRPLYLALALPFREAPKKVRHAGTDAPAD